MNEYGIVASVAAAWAAARAGNARCAEFCRTALRAAANDKQLMDLAITAQAEGAGHLLASLCDEWLGSSLAKERCLAVSLLPWLLDGDAGHRLAVLARDDPSGWVRDHARWAGEVARQEAACRRQYRRVLDQSDANAAKTMLVVLRPALTPAARWWQTTMPFDVHASGAGRKEVFAAITLFWQRVNGVTKSTTELYGRKLEEYLRGEKIANLRSPTLRLD